VSKIKVGDVVRVRQDGTLATARFAGLAFVVLAVYRTGFAELSDASGLYIAAAKVDLLEKVKRISRTPVTPVEGVALDDDGA